MNRTIFLRQLRYWTFHCSLNALPSFCIALFALGLWKNPWAVVAMLAAIGTFILLYSFLTSLPGPMRERDHLLARALRLGVKVRSWLSVASLSIIPFGGMMATPDLWCGYFAVSAIDGVAGLLGSDSQLARSPELAGFTQIYATTLLEGVILSLFILTVSFCAIIFLQVRDRRRFFAAVNPR